MVNHWKSNGCGMDAVHLAAALDIQQNRARDAIQALQKQRLVEPAGTAHAAGDLGGKPRHLYRPVDAVLPLFPEVEVIPAIPVIAIDAPRRSPNQTPVKPLKPPPNKNGGAWRAEGPSKPTLAGGRESTAARSARTRQAARLGVHVTKTVTQTSQARSALLRHTVVVSRQRTSRRWRSYCESSSCLFS